MLCGFICGRLVSASRDGSVVSASGLHVPRRATTSVVSHQSRAHISDRNESTSPLYLLCPRVYPTDAVRVSDPAPSPSESSSVRRSLARTRHNPATYLSSAQLRWVREVSAGATTSGTTRTVRASADSWRAGRAARASRVSSAPVAPTFLRRRVLAEKSGQPELSGGGCLWTLPGEISQEAPHRARTRAVDVRLTRRATDQGERATLALVSTQSSSCLVRGPALVR